jgi:hypothetical protein
VFVCLNQFGLFSCHSSFHVCTMYVCCNSIGKIVAKRFARARGAADEQWLFRLDKEEFTMSLMSVLRSNVIRLFVSSHDPKMFMASQTLAKDSHPSPDVVSKPLMSPYLVQLSSLVIDLASPRFTSHTNHVYSQLQSIIDTDIQLFLPALNPIQLHFLQNLKTKKNADGHLPNSSSSFQQTSTRQFYECLPPPCYAGCHPLTLLQEYKMLNSGQQDVVKKVIASLDYTLLLGMPGSGKTSTLSFVIRTLVARGERILITSYTHSAVDNLMKKLRESEVTPSVMGRLGNIGSLDSSMEEYAVDASDGIMNTVKALSSRIEGYRIIGATVLTAARSGLLQKLAPFDWCVMDEAGQISQPAALGGMLLAKKHLLVGDNYQLPPLVVSLEAQVEVQMLSFFYYLLCIYCNVVFFGFFFLF